MALFDWVGYIRKVYPSSNVHESPCQEGANGQLFIISSSDDLTNIDFALDLGGIIRGTIRNANGDILRGAQRQARLYDAEGNTLKATWNGDQADQYTLGGIIPGTYWVVGSSRQQGLIDEVFDNVACPRFSCGPEAGVPLVVLSGDVYGDTPETAIDFMLEEGSVIQGRITDASNGLPVADHSLAIYDDAGVYAAFAFSDADGFYTSVTALPAGDYYVSNKFPEGFANFFEPYMPMVYPNLTCGEPCDVLSGSAVSVNGFGPVNGIDFVLETGTEVTGTVTTGRSDNAKYRSTLVASSPPRAPSASRTAT
jgi:hypothetical protein